MRSKFHAAIGRTALCIGMLAAPTSVFAQETVDQDEPTVNDDRAIVVTGTLIRGTPEDSALPVDVFSSAELSSEGQTSALDFIKDIPAVGGVIGDSNQFQVQGLGPVGSINLRGLGRTRTLVLLNGRRTIVSPGDGFVDTNSIPIFALERIELLKDGAAVTYGSDAVAGVANFITRKNFEGVEVQADYKFIEDSDGDYTASILGGFNAGPDVNFLAGFGYRHRSPLAAINRDFSSRPLSVNPAPASGIVNPAQYFPALRLTGPLRDNDPGVDQASGVPVGTILLGGGVQDVGCEELGGTFTPASGRCNYNYTNYNNLVEEQNFYQAFGSVNVDLDYRTRFTADVTYSYGEVFTRLSPSYPSTQGPFGAGPTFNFFVPRSNPGFDTFLAQTAAAGRNFTVAPGAPAANGALIVLYRPFALGGYPLNTEFPSGNESTSKNESYRISAGFERDIGDSFTASLYGTYIDANSFAFVPDTIGVRLQNALDGLGGPDCDVATGTPGVGNCYYFNPFSNAIAGNPVLGLLNPYYVGPDADNPAANANRADVIDYFTQRAVENRQKEEQYVVDFLLSGELGALDFGAGPVGLGIGAQYRKSVYKARPYGISNAAEYPCQRLGDTDCPQPLGPFIFQGQLTSSDTEQDVYALFGEVQIPVLDTLEVNLALRFEDYGDPIGSTLDPKASVRFEPTDWLVLRGSVGTTFRAPLAGQVTPGRLFSNLTGIVAANGGFIPVDRFGNPDLEPESAFTYNIGAVVNFGGFNAKVDYFSYDFKGPLVLTPENPIASAVFRAAWPTAPVRWRR